MKHSPLHDRHRALGAKLAEFGGWEMPLEYAGGGVLAEHAAVRSSVGVFDVSHLGKISVVGPAAATDVDRKLSNSLAKIEPGRAQYTLCCDPETGGIVDDMIAYWRADDDIFLIPNAANNAEVARRLAEHLPLGVQVRDRHEEFAVLAVQGPRSTEVLAELGLPTEHDYMSFVDTEHAGAPVTVCRTGYTGEHGYELVVGADAAGALWDGLVGTEPAPRPCGLGARDTLRTEMGYPLHGNDITQEVTPVQARLGFAVGWKKPEFWGRDLLLAERAAGPDRRLRGLIASGRGIPRPGMPVLAEREGGRSDEVGRVTSGTFSPTLRQGIGLALLSTAVPDGAEVTVDIRGRAERFEVRRPPFVEVSPRA